MGRSIIVVGALACLIACTSQPLRVEAMATPAVEPPPVTRPHLPIADIPPNASPEAVMRAYTATVESLAGYAEELEKLLDAYRPTPKARVDPGAVQ